MTLNEPTKSPGAELVIGPGGLSRYQSVVKRSWSARGFEVCRAIRRGVGLGCSGGKADDAAFQGNGDRGGAVVDPELAEHAEQVGLDGRLADVQPPADLLVRQPAGYGAKDLQLAGAERLLGGG